MVFTIIVQNLIFLMNLIHLKSDKEHPVFGEFIHQEYLKFHRKSKTKSMNLSRLLHNFCISAELSSVQQDLKFLQVTGL